MRVPLFLNKINLIFSSEKLAKVREKFAGGEGEGWGKLCGERKILCNFSGEFF